MITTKNKHGGISSVFLGLIFTLFCALAKSGDALRPDSDNGKGTTIDEVHSAQRTPSNNKNGTGRSGLPNSSNQSGFPASVISYLLDEKPVNKPPAVTNLEADPDSFNYPRIYTELAATVIDDGVTGTELDYKWQSFWRGDGSSYVLVNATFDPITIESDNRISSGVAFADVNGYLPRGLYDLYLYVDDGEYVASSSVSVYLIEENCGGVAVKEGEVCVRNCNGMDLIFGDGSKNGHSRTYDNCGSAAIGAGLNKTGKHVVTIADSVNCNVCH